jgi:predicted RNA methylase
LKEVFMTNFIALDRTQIRRNITLQDKPPAHCIDALVRNGFRYDERAQQWWKIATYSAALNGENALSGLDEQQKVLDCEYGLTRLTQEEREYRYQAYYTPAQLADDLVIVADVKATHRCLEPSAGLGIIARALKVDAPLDNIVCVEVEETSVNILENEGFTVQEGDFLLMQPEHTAVNLRLGYFDRIVMNPPFSRDQDVRHVSHAWKFLKPGGKLVAIVGSYALYTNTEARKALQEILQRHGRVVRELPAGTFTNNARAVIIEMNKPLEPTR